ncbi:RTA1 like protein, partial [Canariomyces notabilis]
FRYYHYDPSLAANAVFVGLFGVVAVAHAYLLIRRRAWFFIPFLIGCIFEVGGYIGRIVAANENPNFTLGVYIWQTLLILLGPALMAASIYMVLGRLIRLLDGHKYALIRSTWMTKLFVSGDVLSFLAQGAGGGILSGDDTSQATQDLGQGIILGGLGIQLFFFGLFIFTTILFHFRIAKNPTTRSFSVTTPWRQQLVALYVTSVLVMVRSIFRMAEFALGANSILMQHEAYLLGLDGALMFLVAGIFVWWHPYKALEGYKEMPKR